MPLILIVDDEYVNRLLLTTVLEPAGYTVAHATSGAEALEVMRQHLPDLVVVDLGLADMHGSQLIKLMRADPNLAGLQLALYTATGANKATADFAESMRIRVIIPKPSEPHELLAAVQSALS